jgi:arginine/lysine/ornithine decarboxylase
MSAATARASYQSSISPAHRSCEPSRRCFRVTPSSQAETIDFSKAEGRISAELVTPYPPGIPVVAPGERYTRAILDYLNGVVEVGGFVEGAADQSLKHLRVVAS